MPLMGKMIELGGDKKRSTGFDYHNNSELSSDFMLWHVVESYQSGVKPQIW